MFQNEWDVKNAIQRASMVFVGGAQPPRSTLASSLEMLEACLEWARKERRPLIENDALWPLYLCHSRLGQPSSAADALIRLRGNLERARKGISDPLRRAGIFSAFPKLFPALCEKLYEAGRTKDLLEAIESSKGRAIADRLTQSEGEPVPDPAVYEAQARLGDLTSAHGFHYVTYFVDEPCVYAVLVGNDGGCHAVDRIPLDRETLRGAATHADPRRWGKPVSGANPGSKTPDSSEVLAPMVAWLDQFFHEGLLEEGDHLCYSADDGFLNVPLHYLPLSGGRVFDRLSVSRVHSAFEVARLFDTDFMIPDRYVAFATPSREDMAKPSAHEIASSIHAPAQWLDSRLEGQSHLDEAATLSAVVDDGVRLDRRIVHFGTHGWFPANGNPFQESYLLLASEAGLPDLARATAGGDAGKLTPARILDSGIDLTGSHVSLMACISGLAREGIGGDALGLDWALLQAGASSLLSSHWKVSAAAGARFFERFYEAWLVQKITKAAAFRQAVRASVGDPVTPAALCRGAAFSLGGDFR